jgi:hypothetical protein
VAFLSRQRKYLDCFDLLVRQRQPGGAYQAASGKLLEPSNRGIQATTAAWLPPAARLSAATAAWLSALQAIMFRDARQRLQEPLRGQLDPFGVPMTTRACGNIGRMQIGGSSKIARTAEGKLCAKSPVWFRLYRLRLLAEP